MIDFFLTADDLWKRKKTNELRYLNCSRDAGFGYHIIISQADFYTSRYDT